MSDRDQFPGWVRFINPVMAMFSFLFLFMVAFNVVSALYRHLHPARPPSGLEGSLVALPLLAAALFAGMWVSNWIFLAIPTVKRALSESPHAAQVYERAGRLTRTARWVVPLCIGISVLGAVAPWMD